MLKSTSGKSITLRRKRNYEMASEFDQYARDYEAMQKDPLRHSFSKDGAFFMQRKWLLSRSYLRRSGRDLSSMSWLDMGCGKGELLRLGRPELPPLQAATFRARCCTLS